MIETYKIVSGKYNPLVAPTMNKRSPHNNTKGNDQILQKSHVTYDLKKYCFTNRVVNVWNSLPD